MRQSFALVAAAALFALPVLAQDPMQPWFGFLQRLDFAAPTGFKPVYQTQDGGTYLLELIPEPESTEDWTTRITMTGSAGFVTSVGGDATRTYAKLFSDDFRKTCPYSYSAYALDAPPVSGAVKVFAAQFSCGDVPGRAQSESMLVLVLAGSKDIFSVHWAERAASWKGRHGYDASIWDPRLDTLLASARLSCDPVSGTEPDPECVDN